MTFSWRLFGSPFKFHCDSLLGPKPVTEKTVVHTVGAPCGHTQPTQILTHSEGRSVQFAYCHVFKEYL